MYITKRTNATSIGGTVQTMTIDVSKPHGPCQAMSRSTLRRREMQTNAVIAPGNVSGEPKVLHMAPGRNSANGMATNSLR